MGEFDDHFTDILIEVNDVTAAQDKKSTRKKVSFLIAECFQNIIRHAASNEEADGIQVENPKMFGLRTINGVYYLTTSNIINRNKVGKLTDTLKSLAEYSEEELKAIYINSLDNNLHNEAGGAGLGLIEMARKSKKAPEFLFREINDQYANFLMQLEVIPRNSDLKGGKVSIEWSEDIYGQLSENGTLLVRKGDFSHDQILPLFKLIEANVAQFNAGPKFSKKSIYLLIEILQNISKHGYCENDRTEGIFVISEKDGHFTISGGNFILNEEVDPLRDRLEELGQMNLATLKRNYKRALFDFDRRNKKGGASLGLIDMFKTGPKSIDYTFNTVNNNLSFFSLSITV